MKRREFLTSLGWGALGFTLCPPGVGYGDVSRTRPNFILLLSDDQSWDGLSVQMDPAIGASRDSQIQTPHIAALARQSMRFTQAYASSPVCSPTRAAIQTGKSPAQLHWTKAAPNVDPRRGYRLITPQSLRDLPQSETTIAQLLRRAGYATAHYGKWHLGGGGPQNHGYDESDGNTSNRDAAAFKPPNPVDIFGMGQRAIAFMQRAAKTQTPFFIQLSYYALHYPQNALPETIAKYREKMPRFRERRAQRAAITENLDTGVGELLTAIDRMGLAANTYVIYMSDNGGGGGGRRRALRGGKGTLLEGGIRVPFIVRGPGIAPNSVSSVPIVAHDLLPTFCKLASVRQALPDMIEGGDISHLFTGGSAEVKRRFPGLAFHFPHYQEQSPQSALRLGDYKVIHNYEDASLQLFNLSDDPREMADISARMPQKAKALAEQLQHYLAAVKAQLPRANPHYDPGATFTEPRKTGKANRPTKRSTTTR